MKKILLSTLFAFAVNIIQSNAQLSNPIGFSLTADPIKTAPNAYNALIQVQSAYIPNFTINVGGAYKFDNYTKDKFDIQTQSTSILGEIRFFPYGQRFVSFKKTNYNIEMCNGKYGCLRQFGFKKQTLKESILRGFYIAPGFEKQTTVIEYMPTKELEDSNEKYVFNIKKNAFSIAVGYQAHIAGLTIGLGYKATVSKPKVFSNSDFLKDKDFLTHSAPFNIRLEHGVRLELGINF